MFSDWFHVTSRNDLKFIFDLFQIFINVFTQCIYRKIYLFTDFGNFTVNSFV
jgi:hypothetical protein